MKKNSLIPKDGWQGLKENFSSDALSGFLVFLLALPLSLGIAKASEFPPIFGLITAMIGGIVVSFIAGSPLTIKGPAAGLIVIVAGSVTELGQGNPELGWHLALGAVVVAGALQMLFGLFKLGKYNDIFPLSAVHGMLAAIGIIILSKQIHILAGISPMTPTGKSMVEPLELLALLKTTVPNFFAHKEVVAIGLTSLAIVFGWPMWRINFLKKIPAPLVVLLVSIPMAAAFGLKNTADFKPLLTFDKGFFDIIGVNVSFAGLHQFGTFFKFVIMFALVGSLEALLTVKAIDMLDPYRRKSNYNKDLMAVGFGNVLAGIFGGLPMISEVARSSANVTNGGRTRWANFFHGIFILIFLIFAVKFSDMIPMSALAAMLIGVGWKLAHPKEFGHMFKIGPDQLVVFLVTIVVTLATDLLLGIASGIILKIILHLFRGVSLKSIVKSEFTVDGHVIHVRGSVVFSNFLKLQGAIQKFDESDQVHVDITKCTFIDHSSIEALHHIESDFKAHGGLLDVIGLNHFENVHGSSHHLAARKRK